MSDAYSFDTGDSYKAIVLGNLAQILSMAMLGNNYQGFRAPYVIAGVLSAALTFVLIVKVLREHSPSTRFSRVCLLMLAVFLVTDFPTTLIGRLVESTIIRQLGLLVVLLLYQQNRTGERAKYLLIGLVSTLSVFFIYFSNITPLLVLLSFGVRMLFQKRWAQARKLALWASIGVLIGLMIAELYFFLAWGAGAFETWYRGVFAFSDRLDGNVRDGSVFIFYTKNFLKFFVGNMFFYNPFLLGLFIISFPFCIAYAAKHNADTHFLIVAPVVWFIIQSTLADDWIVRKGLVVFPEVLACIVLFLTQYKKVFLPLLRAIRPWKRALCAGLVGTFYLLCAYYLVRFRNNSGFSADYSVNQYRIVVVSLAIQTVLCVIVLIYLFIIRPGRSGERHMSHGERRRDVFRLLAVMSGATALVCSLAVSLAFDFRFVYVRPAYTEKAAMIQIGEYIGTNYVANPLSYSYMLYNDIRPINGSIDYIKDVFESDDSVNYMIDYDKSPYSAYNYVYSKDDIVSVKTLERSAKAWGRTKNIAIYEKTNVGVEQ